jgi:hypothetical protein
MVMKTRHRDDFPRAIVERLAKRAAQRCSNPGCRRATSGPHEDNTKVVLIGVGAHISAAAPGGPRYDALLTSSERSSIENAIWLCQNCAKLVDSDPNRYSVDLLRNWKKLHEVWVSESISGEQSADVRDRDVIRRLIIFLEDKRILYSPKTGHSVASHMVFVGLGNSVCLSRPATVSIVQIRDRIGKTLEALSEASHAIETLRRMQATCRWALDVSEKNQHAIVRDDPDYEEIWGGGVLEYGMTFLGLFRRKMGKDLQKVAQAFHIRIQGRLSATIALTEPLSHIDEEVLVQAAALVRPYLARHGGFKKMKRGWFEELCGELDEYLDDT